MISVIKSKDIQNDGALLVTEEHTADTGEMYVHTWLCDDELLIDDVCQARGVEIQKELNRQARIKAEATNFEMPLAPVEVMRRLTPQEWAAFQASTDTNIVYFREVFNKTTQIYRNDPLTQAGLQALVSVGILTDSRVSEVLA